MKRVIWLIALLVSVGTLLADDIDPDNDAPWFTGTLLAFYPENAEPCQLAVTSILFAEHRYGIYNQNSRITQKLNSDIYSLLVSLETGITKNIDITLDLLGFYCHTPGGDASSIGDTHVFIGFQISEDKKGSWIPDLRMLVGQGFPTGKYKNLDPDLEFADISGLGAFETSLVFVMRKIFYTWPKHPYNWNINIGAVHSSEAQVEGLNTYGGDPFTQGTIHPSEHFFFNVAFEYKFNQPWGCGIDIDYIYGNRLAFNGNKSDIYKGAASGYLFSLAPMIEYNFSSTFGATGGVWFSVVGRNTFAFTSTVFSLFYEF